MNKTQINYPISRNPWEVIFPAPVHFGKIHKTKSTQPPFLWAEVGYPVQPHSTVVIYVLGPEILLPMGCVKLGNYFAFFSPMAGRRTQINYAISPNPWEVLFPAPVQILQYVALPF